MIPSGQVRVASGTITKDALFAIVSSRESLCYSTANLVGCQMTVRTGHP